MSKKIHFIMVYNLASPGGSPASSPPSHLTGSNRGKIDENCNSHPLNSHSQLVQQHARHDSLSPASLDSNQEDDRLSGVKSKCLS